MAYKDDLKKLETMSPDEINNLEAGIYPDFLAVDLLQREEKEEINYQKILELYKLIMRSPELDQSIEYIEINYELIDFESLHNHGKELLYWVLIGISYYSKDDSGFLMYQDYFDYSRGLLYRGYSSVFVEFLKKLVEKGPISKFQFVDIINDIARLNQIPTARRLYDLGEKLFGSEWDSDTLDKTITEHQSQQGDFPPSIQIDNEIFQLMIEENLDFEPDYEDFDGLISIQELLNLIESDAPIEKYLLFVPDMINHFFNYWDEDRKISFKIMKVLRYLSNSTLPELSILGDLINFDQNEVFISRTFGKCQGFTLSHLEEIINNQQLCSEVRGNAGLMLLDIAQSYPESQSVVIDILSKIIGDPPDDSLESEALITSLVADVLDYDLFELKEAIQKAFNENRIDPVVVQSRDFTSNWNLVGVKHDQIRNGKPIFLKCKVCDRTRRYGFNYILFDIQQIVMGFDWDSRYFFIDHPVKCSKCGAVDNYEIATNSLIGLIPGFFFKDDDKQLLDTMSENIFFFNFDWIQDLGYDQISFVEVRQFVISGNSKRVNPFILGEYYRIIGRYQEALEVLRAAHMAAPNDRRGLIILASVEHDFGDREKARSYYKQILTSTNTMDIYLSVSDPLNKIALSGLADLEEGKPSLLPYPQNITGESLFDYLEREKKQKKRKH